MSRKTKYESKGGNSSLNVNYSVAQVSNTNTTFNLNQAAFGTLVPITGSVEFLDDGFVVNGNGIECTFTGRVKVSSFIRIVSTNQRMAVETRLIKNAQVFGPIGASSYIRNANGHNHGSDTVCAYIDVVPGDIIGVTSRRDGNAGTANMSIDDGIGDSNLIIERLEVLK